MNILKSFGGGIFLGVALSAFFGCQTIPDTPEPIPGKVRQAFAPCAPLDGAMKLDLLRDSDLLGSAEMEWIAEQPGQLISQVVNPLGQPVLRVEDKADAIAISGELADRVPDLSYDEDGFLTVNEYFAGIHREELPCILGAKLPARWLDFVYDVEEYPGRIRIFAYDGKRSIKVSIRTSNDAKTCTWVKWHRFLGMVTRGYKWCIDTDPRQSRMSGIDSYELKWVSLDG